MDPSAHSLAFRGGAEVPDEEYEVQNLLYRGCIKDGDYGDATELTLKSEAIMLGASLCTYKGPGTNPTTGGPSSWRSLSGIKESTAPRLPAPRAPN